MTSNLNNTDAEVLFREQMFQAQFQYHKVESGKFRNRSHSVRDSLIMTGIAPVHSPFLRQPLRQQCNLRLVDNRNCHHKAHQNYQFHAQDYNCIMLIIKIITMMIIHLKQTPIFGPTAFRSSWQWQEPRPLGPSWTSGCGSISGNDYDALLACKFSIMMVVGDSGDKNDNFHPTMASPSPFEANTPGQSA